MNSFYRNILPVFCIVLSISLNGQNLSEDLANIQKVYTGKKALLVDVSYETHLNVVKDKALEQLSGMLCFQDGMTYRKIDSVETFQNTEYSLMIDHKAKVILKNYLSKDESKAFKMSSSGFDFSSFISGYDMKEFKKLSSSKAYYVLTSKVNKTEQITFFFNPSNYNIIEVQIKSLENQSVAVGSSSYVGMPILRIVYKSQKLVKRRDNSFFTDKAYIKKNNGVEVSIAPYQQYQVITNK